MFKNSEFRVKMVKTPAGPEDDPIVVRCNHDPVLMAVIIKDVVTHTALAIAGVVATKQGMILAQNIFREVMYQKSMKGFKN